MFVNPTLDEIAHAADAIGLTHLQLHGDEGPAFCTEVARRTGCKVIKALRIATRGPTSATLERFHTDFHLLDAAAGRCAAAAGARGTGAWPPTGARRSR